MGSGRQSSSRMIASSTWRKTQSRPLEIRFRQPRFTSEKFFRTSQGQSTRSIAARVAAQLSASPGRSGRAPSATTSSFAGRARRISSNTRAVVSGRLKMMKTTGVVSAKTVMIPWAFARG